LIEYLSYYCYRRSGRLPEWLATFPARYFTPLAFGEGDAAGDGLRTGLAVVSGACCVGVLCEAGVVGDGLAAVGVELTAGSVAQPAANRIDESVRVSSAARRITLVFEVVILFMPRFFSKFEKRDDNCPSAD